METARLVPRVENDPTPIALNVCGDDPLDLCA